MGCGLGRLLRRDQHLPQAFGAVGVFHQFGNPHRFARFVLAGEDAHAARRFRNWPLEGPKFGRRKPAVGHRHRSLEIGRTDRRAAARANFLGAGGGVDRGKGDAFDAVAVLGKKRPRRSVVLRLGEHAEQFHVVRLEHHGVVARSHMGAVGAARRYREAQPLPVLGGLVELLHHEHDVIYSDDVLQCHALFPRHPLAY